MKQSANRSLLHQLNKLRFAKNGVHPNVYPLLGSQKHMSTLKQHFESSLLNGTNCNYLEELERDWREDPSKVDPSWANFFTTAQQQQQFVQTSAKYTTEPEASTLKANILAMIRSFQVSGHKMAKLDPLGLYDADLDSTPVKELDTKNYGFSEKEFDQEIHLGSPLMTGFLSPNRPPTTLRKLYERLQETYCGSVGVEIMHILDREQTNWILERFETPARFAFSKEEKMVLLERLIYSDMFERYLANKFPTAKRFGLEGCESLIPGMKAMIDVLVEQSMQEMVIGMPHRGRLNMLANVLRKPLEIIFSEFQGTNIMAGDVKYHLGMSTQRKTRNGKDVRLSLVPNPSHLEAVNPVVEGKVRCKQFNVKDTERKKIVPILLHGDAAFAGQGIVYETMGLSELEGFTTGGTIHVVVNNQIGFTTNPRQSRSSPYCTDLSKYISAPVFHVNGDDIEAVAYVMKVAAEFRQAFSKEVIVDIVCYRKHGHNELDQPMFTQPKMYNAIAQHKSILEQYQDKLVKEGILTAAELKEVTDSVRKVFDDAFNRSKQKSQWEAAESWLQENWAGMKTPAQLSPIRKTGISRSMFERVGKTISSYPETFNIHPTIKKFMESRTDMIKTGQRIDWATAEALAFGSLLLEGKNVRFTGQDVERGTFSQRHAVLTDQKTEAKYMMLENFNDPNAGHVDIINSHLSEFGVLGFEYGYSMESPHNFVLWEAQFGDFVNGAQVIIDQFISSAEQKWQRSSGITLLLPHGYEGQGPEHSNSRYERFLQLSNEDPNVYPDLSRQIQNSNYQVANCTTPANYFHILRRQIHRDFRKPLIIPTPKSLLRYRHCISSFEDLQEGTMFQKVIPDRDELVSHDQVRRVVFCTGKVYYDLWNYRTEKKINDVAIVRVEQLAPFPFDLVGQQAALYKNAEVVWVQEEPQNYGAWYHFYFRAMTAMKHHNRAGVVPRYVGRKASASPATGHHHVHELEQHELVSQAFK